MMRVRSNLIAVALGLVLGLSLAQGAQLSSGSGPVSPDVFSIGFSGTQLAFTSPSSGTSFSTNGGSISGKALMQVLSDPNNAFCTGCVDFLVQIQNNFSSTANITSLTLSGYTGLSTDVGYDSQSVGGSIECGPADQGYCNTSGTGSLGTVSRDTTGNVITFNFAGAGLAPGQSSVVFVVETNSQGFVSATALSVVGANSTSAQNIGGNFSPSTPVPTPTPTPIPPSAILGVTGLAGLGLYQLRRPRK